MRRFLLALLLIFSAGCVKDLTQEPEQSSDLSFDMAQAIPAEQPMLEGYDSCEQLSQDLREKYWKKIEEQMALWPEEAPHYLPVPGCGGGGFGPGDAVSAPMPPAGPLSEGVDFSDTNNQEKGVDEADIIKTDGKFFYVLNQSQLEILSVEHNGELNLVASLALKSPASGMLLMGDRAFILSSDYAQGYNIRLDQIELSLDRRNPELSQSYYFQGSLQTARRIGNKIHIAAYFEGEIPGLVYYPDLPDDYWEKNAEEQDVIWAQAKSQARVTNEELFNNFDHLQLMPSQLYPMDESFNAKPLNKEDCAQVFGAPSDESSGFLNLISFAPEGASLSMRWIRANNPTVYASPEQFIIASSEYASWWMSENSPKTTIHQFKLNVDNTPNYSGSVEVPGTLHDSFSLSEYQGYVRVATTEKTWIPTTGELGNPGFTESKQENHLFIIGEDSGYFGIVSSLEGLAPGEEIWTARFSKDKGFLVTFKQVDPLFTLDLSDPKHPFVAGELKVPGVSTYLQDIGDNQLLAVGYGGNEEGLDWKTSISLFDVSDFPHPKLANTLSFVIQEGLDDSWSGSSEANHNHLAINYFGPAGMTAIPLSASRLIWNELEPSRSSFEVISKLKIVNTKFGSDLTVLGEVDHSQFYQSSAGYWGTQEANIRRSYFVGDYLYAMSSKAITATRLSDMITTSAYEIK